MHWHARRALAARRPRRTPDYEQVAILGGGRGRSPACCAWLFARDLDVLTLGEETAWYSGVEIRRALWLFGGLGCLLAAAAVAQCGLVGFVGLVVPHIGRRLFGPGHRGLIPVASALLGSGPAGDRRRPGAYAQPCSPGPAAGRPSRPPSARRCWPRSCCGGWEADPGRNPRSPAAYHLRRPARHLGLFAHLVLCPDPFWYSLAIQIPSEPCHDVRPHPVRQGPAPRPRRRRRGDPRLPPHRRPARTRPARGQRGHERHAESATCSTRKRRTPRTPRRTTTSARTRPSVSPVATAKATWARSACASCGSTRARRSPARA